MTTITGTGISAYDENIKKLQAQGLKTTKGKSGQNDFIKYLSAVKIGGKNLDEYLKGSYDAGIQADVAQLFKLSNVIQLSDITNPNSKVGQYLKSQGIEVKVNYVHADNYKVDEYAGIGNNVNKSGNIAVITFKRDGKEFKVVDANGNAALETEEVMYNQVLGNINQDLMNEIGSMNADVKFKDLNLSSFDKMNDPNKFKSDSKLFDEEVEKLTKAAEKAKADAKKEEERKAKLEKLNQEVYKDGKRIITEAEYKVEFNKYVEYLKKLDPKASDKQLKEEAKSTMDLMYVIKEQLSKAA